jgi:hypothetical protein
MGRAGVRGEHLKIKDRESPDHTVSGTFLILLKNLPWWPNLVILTNHPIFA